MLSKRPDQVKLEQYDESLKPSNITQPNDDGDSGKNGDTYQDSANQATAQGRKKRVFFLFSIPVIILSLIFYPPVACVLIVVRIVLELVRRSPKKKKAILISLVTMFGAVFAFLLWIGLTYEAPDVPANADVQSVIDEAGNGGANALDEGDANFSPEDNNVAEIAGQAESKNDNGTHAATGSSSSMAAGTGDKVEMDSLYASDPLYLKAYLNARDIKVHEFSRMGKLETEIDKITAKDAGEVHYIEKVDKSLQPSYYGVTIEYSDTYYIGVLKDMKPHGAGVLFKLAGGVPCIAYAGEFKSGRFDGLGMEFNVPNRYMKEFRLYTEDIEEIDEITLAEAVRRLNYCVYQGEFKEGERHGKGNIFEYPLIPIDEASAKEWTDKELNVQIGEYKKGKLDGKYKTYMRGILYEEGTTIRAVLSENSDIKRYFPGTTQLWYDGELKNDKYDGKGTLYAKDGSIVYSGKWKDGDIAK